VTFISLFKNKSKQQQAEPNLYNNFGSLQDKELNLILNSRNMPTCTLLTL